ncbi:glycerophosphodiester phosphodiesterase family protein [Streptomyces sp. NBC_00893]|uniref:glycerophosphodiester phosphodiesterase n=1 Tax=Streptomyces sp. NBC_00893 TaxID=2975862 RepID=UPI00224E1F42|nr:glycerophosphodiester phosphodiesterase family protein [Streptomyces sp. NBC_00893]MCX4848679.1 glycerophosphodiester phosphodiesterase family protein [Streptomyces sp. NBC_00893]
MYVRTATAALSAAALMGAGAYLMSPADTQNTGRTTAAGHTTAVTGVSAVSARTPGTKRTAPVVFAHRGASAYAPENTLAAVDKADALGFDWVENDVQFTKDGVLVVVHDTDLKRTTDAEEVFPDRAPWAVKDFTAAEIARLDAGSWFGPEFAGTRVPTLKQYLDRIERNRQKLLLEIKSPEIYPGIEKETLRVLRQKGWLDRSHVKNRLVIQSFGADSVKKVHQLRPDVTTGFLGTPAVAELPSYAAFTDQINPSYTSVSADYVDAVHALKGAHGKKLRVNTWTVNDAATAAKVAGLGVDGIITNNPDVVREATR